MTRWTPEDPGAGDFTGIEDMARQLRKTREWLDTVIENAGWVAGHLHTAWTGPGADAFGTSTWEFVVRLNPLREEVDRLHRAARGYLSEVPEHISGEVRGVKFHRQYSVEELEKARERYARDLLLDPALGTYLSPEAQRIQYYEGEIETCDRRLEMWAERRTEADASFASAIRGADLSFLVVEVGPITIGGGGGGFGFGVGATPPVTLPAFWYYTNLTEATPEEIRAQWDQLTAAQREALIADQHAVLGNLDGIPLGWRARANELNIRDEIERLEKAQEELGKPSFKVDDYGWSQSQDRLRHVAKEKEKLQVQIDYLRTLLDNPYPYDGRSRVANKNTLQFDADGNPLPDSGRSQVVLFDPDEEAIAIYHGLFDANGDIPSWYRNVAVHVPGTGTTIAKTANPNARAAAMYDQANQVPGEPTAVFMWAGGPFPQSIPEAMLDFYANDLSSELRDFVDTARTPSVKDADWTVIGHSYGGTVVSTAEQAGLVADRIVYVASAGMGIGVGEIEDFPHTSDAEHYALYAPGDGVVGAIQGEAGAVPVAGAWLSAVHGDTAHRAQGVTRLETGWLNREEPSKGTVEDSGLLAKHSEILAPKSTAFKNIVAVITGEDALLYDGTDVDDAGRESQYRKVPDDDAQCYADPEATWNDGWESEDG